MLVWYYIPGGMSNIPELRMRIYGYKWGHDPHDVSYDIYYKYRSMLVLAPFDRKWLLKKYNVDFGDISFTYSEIRYLPYNFLFNLAVKMNLIQGRGKPRHKKLAMMIRNSLRSK